MTGPLRLLVLLPQLPDDPASGASRTVTTIASLMASAGFEVELIASTATEAFRPLAFSEALAHLGAGVAVRGPVVEFERRGVAFTVLDAQMLTISASVEVLAPAYDHLVDRALSRLRPHVVLTYGGSPREVERQRRIRAAGVKVVFGLYNMRYFRPGFFGHVDAVITPSEFLSDRYREIVSLRSQPLPDPLWPADVVAARREPRRVTMVNPTLDKGLMVFLAIARLLAEQHPDIPIEVFTSRDSERSLRHAAFLAGADLDRPGITIHPSVSTPSLIYEHARVVMVPSLFEDPAPRVVAEAFVNGAVPVGSDRGGIPEMCAQAGFVVPIPRSIEERSLNRVPAKVAQPWVDRIAELMSKEDAWRKAVERATRVAADYLPATTTDVYAAYFTQIAGLRSVPGGTAGPSRADRHSPNGGQPSVQG